MYEHVTIMKSKEKEGYLMHDIKFIFVPGYILLEEGVGGLS